MDIIDHGDWVAYTPDPWPKHLPSHIIFARRVSDGRDWYEFQRKELTGTDTVKMTLRKTDIGWAVLTTNLDGSALFPAGLRVIEVRGMVGDHESFRTKILDLAKSTFAMPPEPPPSMLKLMMEELGIDETQMRAKLDAFRNRRTHG